MKQQLIKISKLKGNTGQIIGLPKNPRTMTNDAKDKLRQSIIESPEILEFKSLVVYPFEDYYVTIIGNQRLAICRGLKFKELPCFVLPVETTIDKLKEYSIKDNLSSGSFSWPMLNADWGLDILESWGLTEFGEDKKVEFTVKGKPIKFELIIECENEEEKEQTFDKLIGEGYKVKKNKNGK
jgi:hypothetical protein